MSGLTVTYRATVVSPNNSLAFLHLKTVNQNASLEADLHDLKLIPYVSNTSK